MTPPLRPTIKHIKENIYSGLAGAESRVVLPLIMLRRADEGLDCGRFFDMLDQQDCKYENRILKLSPRINLSYKIQSVKSMFTTARLIMHLTDAVMIAMVD